MDTSVSGPNLRDQSELFNHFIRFLYQQERQFQFPLHCMIRKTLGSPKKWFLPAPRWVATLSIIVVLRSSKNWTLPVLLRFTFSSLFFLRDEPDGTRRVWRDAIVEPACIQFSVRFLTPRFYQCILRDGRDVSWKIRWCAILKPSKRQFLVKFSQTSPKHPKLSYEHSTLPRFRYDT